MKKYTNVNKDQITEIYSYIDKECTRFEWREDYHYKFLWIKKVVPAHWRDSYTLGGGDLEEKDIITHSDKIFIRNRKVYYYPYMIIITNSGEKHRIQFQTKNDLFSYFKREFKGINWVDTSLDK